MILVFPDWTPIINWISQVSPTAKGEGWITPESAGVSANIYDNQGCVHLPG